jgi:2-iminobutanoate/2-iminopropanoate deaminase
VTGRAVKPDVRIAVLCIIVVVRHVPHFNPGSPMSSRRSALRRPLAVLIVLAGATSSAQAQVAPRDSSIVRGDRTIWHEHHPSEREWGYAQAIVIGNTIHMSGTIGGGATMEEQLRQIYRRIERGLAKHGAGMEHIVRETVFTKDVQALAAANAVRKAAYAGHTPAASWVQVTRLLAEQALVEIEVTAVLPSVVPSGR